jgi:hypothetical protein
VSDTQSGATEGAVNLLIQVGSIVLAIWLIALAVVLSLLRPEGTINAVGDGMNVVNSLFTGLALAAVSVSIHFQRVDYRATLQEMKGSGNTARAQARIDVLRARMDVQRSILEMSAGELRASDSATSSTVAERLAAESRRAQGHEQVSTTLANLNCLEKELIECLGEMK